MGMDANDLCHVLGYLSVGRIIHTSIVMPDSRDDQPVERVQVEMDGKIIYVHWREISQYWKAASTPCHGSPQSTPRIIENTITQEEWHDEI